LARAALEKRIMEYGPIRIIHITAIVLTFMGLSGLLALRLGGGAPLKQRLIFHFAFGIGLITVLITGFMLAGILGYHSPPPWMLGKFAIWVLAAASMFLVNRLSRFAPWILVFFVLLVGTAAWLAIYKPMPHRPGVPVITPAVSSSTQPATH
jgi:hypothetical protein